MHNPKKFAAIFFLLLGVLALNLSSASSGQAERIYVSVDDILKDLGGDWEKAFTYLRDQVRFDPSPHVLKSSQSVLWGCRGNAKEQALLLLDILANQGERARLVKGRLVNAAASTLISSLFPGDTRRNFSYAEDVPLSQPSDDEMLLSRIKDHYWVQIERSGKWLDLDPVFPRSAPGQKFAEVEKTFTRIPDDFYPKMKISMSVEKDDTREDVLSAEEYLQNLTNRPMTLSISTTFQETEEDKGSGGGTPGGVFGGLSRSTSVRKKAKGVEAIYRAELKIGEEMGISGEFREVIPDSQRKDPVDGSVDRVWLNFRLMAEGEVLLETERVLFERLHEGDEFPLFQRHSMLFAPNIIPVQAWEDKLEKATDARLLDEVKSGIDEIKAEVKAKKDRGALLDRCIALEEKIGPEMGHLVNMIFAYASDSITKDAGKALSVYSYFSLPRIIIHSVEGDGKKVATTIDLRYDSISALSYPGQAVAMEETFLYGRGVFESVLEGKVLELFMGKKALTTASIMQEATRRRIPIRFYSELEKDELVKLRMPDHVQDKALKAVASGSILIVPERSIRFEGKDRWGWWEIVPDTREVTGVLDTGLHQAMLQRTVLDTEGMLNAKMGFAIGAITGAVDTQWMLAGMVLKYGELNKQALQEIKNYMKQIKAYMCPEFEKSASVTITSATVIDIEDCYKKEFSWGYEGGVKVEMGWCQAFAKGFGCASTSILNYYLSQYE